MIVLPILLLLKPNQASKPKKHAICLEKKEGNLNELLIESRTIQNRLLKTSTLIPFERADQEYQSSLLVTYHYFLEQDDVYGYEIIAQQLESKATVKNNNNENCSNAARNLPGALPESLQRSVNLASEKGCSIWVTVLPLSEHGFALHKGAIQDALALQLWLIPS